VADVEGALVVVKYKEKQSSIGFVGMVVGKDEGLDFYKKDSTGHIL